MAHEAVLHARPTQVTGLAPVGLQPLNLGSRRDSYYYVPPGYNPAHPAPLVLLLHGAGGHAHHGLQILQHLADENSLILLAPAAAGQTWDVIVEGGYGTDVALIDQSLERIFNHCTVDVSHLAIGGFSDGASYAFSLGLSNGDLFTHVIAFSPGFVAPVTPRGRPEIFISHGIKDTVLPIAHCSRRIVPRLEQAGYAVAYHEFDDGHVVPPDIAQKAVDWLLQSPQLPQSGA
jgi:phospholipase/carboxylesterase